MAFAMSPAAPAVTVSAASADGVQHNEFPVDQVDLQAIHDIPGFFGDHDVDVIDCFRLVVFCIDIQSDHRALAAACFLNRDPQSVGTGFVQCLLQDVFGAVCNFHINRLRRYFTITGTHTMSG